MRRAAFFLAGCLLGAAIGFGLVAVGGYILRVGGGQALLLAVLVTFGLFALVLGVGRR